MRTPLRLVVTPLAGAVLVIGLAPAAGAAPAGSPPIVRNLTGSVSGQAPFTFDSACSFVHQRWLGEIETASGTAQLATDGCVDFGGSGFVYSGTFTIEGWAGEASGTVTGTIPLLGTDPSHFDLTVTAGTRGMHATVGAVLHADLVWYSNQTDGGPFSGVVTG